MFFSTTGELFTTRTTIKMKQLHNISNHYLQVKGNHPKGCVCILDIEFLDKRCLRMTNL
ncbi:hypothetical protein CHRY9393_03107 [Chryseobacterium fistulae]|uniref:Uncharacterized protein n=1 Tax=Chryseobacterium fistulae TaxID=2675058 RepID=A0A6N4XSG0_9FLAO|nr:hypothetical protein CHRY9393_03107 [Chryseobacterium fistulae]